MKDTLQFMEFPRPKYLEDHAAAIIAMYNEGEINNSSNIILVELCGFSELYDSPNTNKLSKEIRGFGNLKFMSFLPNLLSYVRLLKDRSATEGQCRYLGISSSDQEISKILIQLDLPVNMQRDISNKHICFPVGWRYSSRVLEGINYETVLSLESELKQTRVLKDYADLHKDHLSL